MCRSKLGVSFVLVGVVFGGRAWAQVPKTPDIVAVGKKATALVEVTSPGADGGGSGTAFCIDKLGLFITNAQLVVEEAEGAGRHPDRASTSDRNGRSGVPRSYAPTTGSTWRSWRSIQFPNSMRLSWATMTRCLKRCP